MSHPKQYQLLYPPLLQPPTYHASFLQPLLPQSLPVFLLTASFLHWSFRSNSSIIFPLLCSLSSFAIYNPNSFWLSVCLTVTSSIYSCCYFLQLFPVTFNLSSCLYSFQIVSFSFFFFFYFLLHSFLLSLLLYFK